MNIHIHLISIYKPNTLVAWIDGETNFEPVQSLVSAITKAHHLLIVVLRMFLCFAGRKSSPILSYTTHSSLSPKNHPKINQKEFYCVFAACFFLAHCLGPPPTQGGGGYPRLLRMSA